MSARTRRQRAKRIRTRAAIRAFVAAQIDFDTIQLLDAALASAQADTPEDVEGHACFCGGPTTENPHPDAGKPATVCEVGAMWVCIPCTVRTRHRWAERAGAAESALAEIAAAHDHLQEQKRLRAEWWNVSDYSGAVCRAEDALAAIISKHTPKETP